MEFSETKRLILQQLLDGKFHSGANLAKSLLLSRTTIWKQIQGLIELGISVNAVSGKGYRLSQPVDLLESSSIVEQLSQNVSQLAQLEIFNVLDSTNSYLARSLAADKGKKGTVCLAESQSSGKGRLGRSWVSPTAANIYLSVLWQYDKGAAALGGLSLAGGVAIMRALLKAGVMGVGLKWPNDIMWEERKLAGILVEITGESHGPCHVIFGLGLNVNMPADTGSTIDQPWVDMNEVMGGKQPSRNLIVSLLLNELLPMLDTFGTTGLTPYLAEWRQWDGLTNKDVTLTLAGNPVLGKVMGIADSGAVIIRSPDGVENQYSSGEVTLKPLKTQ
ncbi:MAG: bifunctional biotin--[acetyl-CoA-carboxylase] ligase/biotin operon repressor BirA [Methylococcales bacterium]